MTYNELRKNVLEYEDINHPNLRALLNDYAIGGDGYFYLGYMDRILDREADPNYAEISEAVGECYRLGYEWSGVKVKPESEDVDEEGNRG